MNIIVALIIAPIVIIIAPIVIIVAMNDNAKMQKKERERKLYWEEREKEQAQRVAALEEKKRAEQERKTEECIEIFSRLPGWEIWDDSVHRASGQYDRMVRSEGTRLFVDEYDSEYGYARVCGKSGGHYMTSSKRCSCYDYRKRKLPCKHMYAVAFLLNENINKGQPLMTRRFKPLYGFSVASAGRFADAKRNGSTIRELIIDLGGSYANTVNQSVTFLVCGAGTSDTKINAAKDLDMEIVSYETLTKMFQTKQHRREYREE